MAISPLIISLSPGSVEAGEAVVLLLEAGAGAGALALGVSVAAAAAAGLSPACGGRDGIERAGTAMSNFPRGAMVNAGEEGGWSHQLDSWYC